MTRPSVMGALLLLAAGCQVVPTPGDHSAEQPDGLFFWNDQRLAGELPISPALFDPSAEMFDGRPVTELLHELRNGEDRERCLAARAMSRVWFGLPWPCGLSGTWGYMSPEHRRATLAAARGGQISRRAEVLVPALVEALEDPCAEVRKHAASSLMMIGPEACAAHSALRQRLRDDQEDEWVRAWAARAIYYACLDVPAAIDGSVALMRSASADIRSMAACNIELMGVDGRAAEPFLRELARDESPKVRGQAAQALGRIRAAATPAPPR